VNCLVPRDPHIRISAQTRNYSQSLYDLEYVQADVRSESAVFAWRAGGSRALLATIVLLLFTGLVFLRRLRHPAALSR
jgi:hypothetical protein